MMMLGDRREGGTNNQAGEPAQTETDEDEFPF
jgi:hypothetical protein